MCGYLYCFSKNISRGKFSEALTSFAYRGPDASNLICEANEYFGHNRLSILGASNDNTQPFKTEEDILLYNGEYLNFENSHYYNGEQCDTPVFYKALKNNDLNHLHGFYSYTLINDDFVHFGVDLFGQKPLFYSISNDEIIVSSDIKAFKFLIELKLSKMSMKAFLQYTHMAPGKTIYDNVHQVLPGETITISKKTFEVTKVNRLKKSVMEMYTKPKINPKFLFRQAMSDITRSDFPVAISASAGFDSSLVRDNTSALKIYSVQKANFSEFDVAVGSDVTVIKPSINSLTASCKKVLDIFGQPFGNPTALLMDRVCAKCNEDGIKVLLTGEFADEVMQGYPRHKLPYFLVFLQKLLHKMPWITRYLTQHAKSARLLKFLLFLRSPTNKIYQSLYNYTLQISENDDFQQYEKDPYIFNFINDVYYFAYCNMFAISDRVGMYHSVEVRTPFADKRLLMANLGNVCRRFLPLNKNLFFKNYRAAAKSLFSKKEGFNPNITQVIIDDIELFNEACARLSRIDEINDEVDRIKSGFQSKPATWSQLAFSLLVLDTFLLGVEYYEV